MHLSVTLLPQPEAPSSAMRMIAAEVLKVPEDKIYMTEGDTAVTPIDYSQEAEIPDKLKNIDGIMSCDSVAGSPSFMLTVRVESPSKLEELLNLIHRTVSVSTETTIVLQRYFAK